MSNTHRFPSALIHGNVRQPFAAQCAKCSRAIYFDIDPGGIPGFNGDWGDGDGDYGCEVDSGDDSEDGNGHVPTQIRYDRHLYPREDSQRRTREVIMPEETPKIVRDFRAAPYRDDGRWCVVDASNPKDHAPLASIHPDEHAARIAARLRNMGIAPASPEFEKSLQLARKMTTLDDFTVDAAIDGYREETGASLAEALAALREHAVADKRRIKADRELARFRGQFAEILARLEPHAFDETPPKFRRCGDVVEMQIDVGDDSGVEFLVVVQRFGDYYNFIHDNALTLSMVELPLVLKWIDSVYPPSGSPRPPLPTPACPGAVEFDWITSSRELIRAGLELLVASAISKPNADAARRLAGHFGQFSRESYEAAAARLAGEAEYDADNSTSHEEEFLTLARRALKFEDVATIMDLEAQAAQAEDE